MRRLISLLSVIGMIVGFPAAVVAFVAASHLGMVTSSAKPEPQEMRLADLVKNGAGDNLHVTLIGFTPGKPVFEEKNGRRSAAWVPLYPVGRRGGTPPALLRSELATDPEGVNALLSQEPLRLMVSSSMPQGRWNFQPAALLYNDYPKLDPDKTVVLIEPAFVVNRKAYLRGAQLFDPTLSTLAWVVTAGALGCGLAGAAGYFLASRKKGTGKRGSKRELLDHKRLPEQQPISNHAFLPEGAFKKALIFGGCALVTGVMGLVLVAAGAGAFKKRDMTVALLAGGIGLAMVMGSAVLIMFTVSELFFPIKRVALYRGGIRWVRGDTVYTALWSDIDEVYRQTTEVYYNGQYKGTFKQLTLKLCCGQWLRFDADVLGDYDSFADGVQGAHGGYVLSAKQREQADTGEATFGDIAVRRDGVSVGGNFIPWKALERYEVACGHLNLYSSQFSWSKCRSFALQSIPNYAALLEMLRPRVMSY